MNLENLAFLPREPAGHARAVPFGRGRPTVALAYLYLVHFGYTCRGVALATTLFCATSALISIILALLRCREIPYALISLLALWALEEQARSPLGILGLQIALGLGTGLPFLTRSIGLVLVPAGLVTLYLAGKRIHWVGLGVAFVIVPWVLWMIAGLQHTQDEIGIYYTNYGGWWSAFGWLNLSRLFLIKTPIALAPRM